MNESPEEEELSSDEEKGEDKLGANDEPILRKLPPNSMIIIQNIAECRDTLSIQKDNVVILATVSESLCGRGAKDIWKQINVPCPLTLHQVATTKFINKRCFILPIKSTIEECISHEDWYNCLCALHPATLELQCT